MRRVRIIQSVIEELSDSLNRAAALRIEVDAQIAGRARHKREGGGAISRCTRAGNLNEVGRRIGIGIVDKQSQAVRAQRLVANVLQCDGLRTVAAYVAHIRRREVQRTECLEDRVHPADTKVRNVDIALRIHRRAKGLEPATQ